MKKNLILAAILATLISCGVQAADQLAGNTNTGKMEAIGHTIAQVDVNRLPVMVKLGGICADIAEAMNSHEKAAAASSFDLVVKMTSTNGQLVRMGCGYNSMPLFTASAAQQTLAGQPSWMLKTDAGLPAVLMPLLDRQINAEFDQEFGIAKFDSGGTYLLQDKQRSTPVAAPAPKTNPITSSIKALGSFLTGHQ